MAESDADDLELEEIENPDLLEDEDDLPLEEENPDDPDLRLEEEDPPRRRAPGRIARLANENRELRERLARVEGRTEAFERAPLRTGPTPEEQRAEQERISQMSDREYADYVLNKERSNLQGAFAQQSFQTGDIVDSMRFERACETNQAYARVAKEVERRLTEMRRNGNNVERKILANVIIGERVAEKGGKAPAREAPRRKPASGGSDVGAERGSGGRKGKTAADRLANVKF